MFCCLILDNIYLFMFLSDNSEPIFYKLYLFFYDYLAIPPAVSTSYDFVFCRSLSNNLINLLETRNLLGLWLQIGADQLEVFHR